MSDEPDKFEKMLQEIVKPRRDVSKRAEQLLDSEDGYTVILRGHSMIHASLNDAVRVKTMDRVAFDKAKLSFRASVYLAMAHKILEDVWEPFLTSLDSLRGELAHSFERDVGPKEVEMLLGKLPEHVKKLHEAEDLKQLFTLQTSILLVVMTGQGREQEHEYERTLEYYRKEVKGKEGG
jgi:hypothetical protein